MPTRQPSRLCSCPRLTAQPPKTSSCLRLHAQPPKSCSPLTTSASLPQLHAPPCSSGNRLLYGQCLPLDHGCCVDILPREPGRGSCCRRLGWICQVFPPSAEHRELCKQLRVFLYHAVTLVDACMKKGKLFHSLGAVTGPITFELLILCKYFEDQRHNLVRSHAEI